MARIKIVDRAPRIRDISKTEPLVPIETVAAALGPPVATISVRGSAAGSAYGAVRAELAHRLGSTGGRPGLENADRRQKIPLADEDWRALVELAESMSDQSPRPTPGQIASAMIRVGLREPARAGYPIVGRTGASRASDSAASPRSGATTPRFPALVQLAARRYRDQLAGLVAAGAPRVAAVASAIRDVVELAEQRPDRVRSAQLEAVAAEVEALAFDDRARLINQYALGLGRDDAEVIVVGTEQAFGLGDVRSLMRASYCDQVSWLTGGRAELPASVAGDAAPRPFHVHPTDWYDVGGAHTWVRLAAVLGSGDEYRPRAAPGLGDLAYQIELSAFPSQRNATGVAPTAERLEFLEVVVRTLAASARVLVFHGRAASRELEPARRTLARAFLGTSRDPAWNDLGERNRPLRYADAAGRRVIVTRALANSGVTYDFVRRLAELVRGAAPTRAPQPRAPDRDRDSARRELLDAAAGALRDTLGCGPFAPNGSRAQAQNREARFARGVQVGVAMKASAFRVFLWTIDPTRQRVFEEILAAVEAGTLPPPMSDAALAITPGAKAADLRYLGVELGVAEPDDLVERTADFAAWLLRVRERF